MRVEQQGCLVASVLPAAWWGNNMARSRRRHYLPLREARSRRLFCTHQRRGLRAFARRFCNPAVRSLVTDSLSQAGEHPDDPGKDVPPPSPHLHSFERQCHEGAFRLSSPPVHSRHPSRKAFASGPVEREGRSFTTASISGCNSPDYGSAEPPCQGWICPLRGRRAAPPQCLSVGLLPASTPGPASRSSAASIQSAADFRALFSEPSQDFVVAGPVDSRSPAFSR